MRIAAWLVLIETLARISGSTLLLAWLGAPSWALAWFALANVRVSIFSVRPRRHSI